MIKKRKALTVKSKQAAAKWRDKMSSDRIGGTNGSALAPSSTPMAKNQSIARKVARGAVRTAMVGVSLASAYPVAALGYATSSTVSTVALMNRIQSGSGGRRPARPAGQPLPLPGNTGAPGQASPVPPQNPPAQPPGTPANQLASGRTPGTSSTAGNLPNQLSGSPATDLAGGRRPASRHAEPAQPQASPAPPPGRDAAGCLAAPAAAPPAPGPRYSPAARSAPRTGRDPAACQRRDAEP
ncbi:hypothetical protein ACN6AT_37055 (plasmid) [Streptomyces sp. JL4002]|uniref:hypothetical protein n=1 Tax=Streptomyces sp. JL4002 TaxID=3404781 RepID=UPI003B28A07F